MPLILAVVVLYNKPPEGSATLQGLRTAFAQEPELLAQYSVLLWDNSRDPLPMPQLGFPFAQRHSERNAGVAGAYNGASVVARDLGAAWLLLLDDDTAVTASFLRTMAGHGRECASEGQVAAIVPFLFSGTSQLSPRYVRFNRQVPVPAGRMGLERREIFAANSGTVMRVDALAEIGGYSAEFWLDYSDLYVFHRFFLAGKSVFLAGDARLEHEIAMLDYDKRMTPERYRNFLRAEGAFHDLFKGRLENGAQLVRLLMRSIRQRRLANPAFSRMTLDAFKRRLWTGRRRRIASWRAENSHRQG